MKENLGKYVREGFEVYAILKEGHTYSELQKDYRTLSVDKSSSWDGAFFGHVDVDDAENFINDFRIDTVTEVAKVPRPKKDNLR